MVEAGGGDFVFWFSRTEENAFLDRDAGPVAGQGGPTGTKGH